MLKSKIWLKIRNASKKPPHVIFDRIKDEIKIRVGVYTTPIRIAKFNFSKILAQTGQNNLDSLWAYLGQQPYIAHVGEMDTNHILIQNDKSQILEEAEKAFKNQLSLLGTGWISLGDKIDWHKDYKSGLRWDPKYITKINYCNPNDFSDVKIPWEISRFQWAMPLGQAYVITKDERYAKKVKDLLLDWIANNPYAASVNWTCTMEAALRVFSLTWFFHIFKDSKEWGDVKFRETFIKSIWLHVDFTERHIEKSDVNGNHFTADAAGMVVGGLFFGKGKDPLRWVEQGWKFLEDEFPKQVFNDGVDYEASVPYHRLNLELFFYPAYFRIKNGLPVDQNYIDRLIKMAEFSAAYTRADGTVPVWGDADDARTLPYRVGAINDHRYVIGLLGLTLDRKLLDQFSGPLTELVWAFGIDAVNALADQKSSERGSKAFYDGGFYILRDEKNHVFIDCGPLGLAGRGGHGHNDILAFEAYLKGVPLISDSGSYLYTADYQERNNFRSTAYHNTPQINGEDINRVIRWDYLWNLQNDAEPILLDWKPSKKESSFKGSHTGYQRNEKLLTPIREITLFHDLNSLLISDSFSGTTNCDINIPFHFHPEVKILALGDNEWKCTVRGEDFRMLNLSNQNWDSKIEDARISFSYGTVNASKKLSFSINGNNSSKLTIAILPFEQKIEDLNFISKG